MTGALHTSPYTEPGRTSPGDASLEKVMPENFEPEARQGAAEAKVRVVRAALLDWYGKQRRPLPWRATRDPYHIWVSEIMLQQTQVATVIGFYERWLRRFPDVGILRVFSRPALHKPMFIDAPAFGNFLLFARFNNGRPDHPVLDDGHPVPEAWLQAIKETGDRLSFAIGWRPGDVLMLDNTRFMHGRTAIIDPGERLIASYFGYLGFAIPDPEEPADPIWRREDFQPPLPPDHPGFREELRVA